jgi:hypothetical protein
VCTLPSQLDTKHEKRYNLLSNLALAFCLKLAILNLKLWPSYQTMPYAGSPKWWVGILYMKGG